MGKNSVMRSCTLLNEMKPHQTFLQLVMRPVRHPIINIFTPLRNFSAIVFLAELKAIWCFSTHKGSIWGKQLPESHHICCLGEWVAHLLYNTEWTPNPWDIPVVEKLLDYLHCGRLRGLMILLKVKLDELQLTSRRSRSWQTLAVNTNCPLLQRLQGLNQPIVISILTYPLPFRFHAADIPPKQYE